MARIKAELPTNVVRCIRSETSQRVDRNVVPGDERKMVNEVHRWFTLVFIARVRDRQRSRRAMRRNIKCGTRGGVVGRYVCVGNYYIITQISW